MAQDGPVPPPRPPRAAAAALALAAALGTAGCIAPSTDITGAVGVTVDDAGHPVVVAEVCSGDVAHVAVHGPNRGERPNEVLASFTAGPAATGPFTLDLADPGAGWTGDPLPLPLGPELHAVSAGGTGDTALSGATFTAAELADLRPGQVLSERSEEPQDAEAFAQLACAAPEGS